MRFSRSSSRKISNRRTYRPDRHVYRSLRRAGQRRPRSWVWMEILIALLALAGIVAVIRWAFF